MHLSLSHLRQYVAIPTSISPKELADLITTSIAEVEGFEIVARENIVVGKVLSVAPHPNADRLRVAEVTDGKKKYQVVCGGINLKEKQLVALAYVGAKVKWHGEGEEITLEKVNLRGVESEGMICASSEIGLKFAEGEREILDLTGKVATKDVGKNLYEALGIPGEVIFEIDNKSLTHRPDLFGHYGFARDIACVLCNQGEFELSPSGTPGEAEGLSRTAIRDSLSPRRRGSREKVKLKSYPQIKPEFGTKKLDIRVESRICQAFSSVLVENITVKPSPTWLQQALLSIGIRPINNIVDITNYVMADLGQPMHAYDYAQIDGQALVIRKAFEGERALALNEKTYELSAEDDVISDKEKPLLITGIMGCENSGISETTTSILLEAGSWDPTLVRKMGQRLGLRSDASTRFEKDIDPRYTTQAIVRALGLIKKLLPKSKIASALFEYSNHSKEPKEITLDLGYASRLLGIEVDPKKAESILKDLGCTVKKLKTKNKKQKDDAAPLRHDYTVENNQSMTLSHNRGSLKAASDKGGRGDFRQPLIANRCLAVTPPSWRSTKDLLTPEDLIEEIGRVLGYGDIPYIAPTGKLFPHIDAEKKFERKLKEIMSKQLGYHEVENYSLTTEEKEQAITDKTSGIEVANPLSRDLTHFKASLIPNLLENATVNARLRNEFKLFETARLYQWKGGNLVESRHVAAVLARDKRLDGKQSSYNHLVFRAKEDMEELLASLAIVQRTYTGEQRKTHHPLFAPQTILVTVDGKEAGSINVVMSETTDLSLCDVVILELNMDTLLRAQSRDLHAKSLPKFPESVRDIALVIPKETTSENIETALRLSSPLVTDVSLFDVFEGTEIGAEKRSLAYHLTLRADDHTLTEDEIGQTMVSAEKSVASLGATVRK